MIHINWSTTAFAAMESLTEETAFNILDSVDMLASFPELGAPLGYLYPRIGNCRQLIFKRKYRMIYDYDADGQEIRVLMLQHCRQQLPTAADLHRTVKEIKLADEEESPS